MVGLGLLAHRALWIWASLLHLSVLWTPWWLSVASKPFFAPRGHLESAQHLGCEECVQASGWALAPKVFCLPPAVSLWRSG